MTSVVNNNKHMLKKYLCESGLKVWEGHKNQTLSKDFLFCTAESAAAAFPICLEWWAIRTFFQIISKNGFQNSHVLSVF